VQIRADPRVGACSLPVLDDSGTTRPIVKWLAAPPLAPGQFDGTAVAGSSALHQEAIKHASSIAKALMIMLARVTSEPPRRRESQK